jgi:hypothetical protein
MSFWGATNWQIVKSSEFYYSQEPDKIKVTADDRGMPRRYYKLTWNSPEEDIIRIKQTLRVQLVCMNTLFTKAQLPYSDEVLKRFSSSLGSDKKDGINPTNPQLEKICSQILKQAGKNAEDAVELVCDWINDNIEFERGQRTSDEALAQKKGSCTPMSKLACAMLRRMGIPAERVSGKFINGDSGHSFIEVYLPDAGWLFYDLSNWNRGFKSLDCILTAGWSYRAGTPQFERWIDGYFCRESDVTPFREFPLKSQKCIRQTPLRTIVAGVSVVRSAAPSSVKKRDIPLCQLILDLDIPPGPREYSGYDASKAASSESSKKQ